MLEANTPLIEAIEITANQIRNKNLVYILFSLKEEIVQGRRLGYAMKKFPGVFSETYISMVSAGDSSGNLHTVFSKLADYLEEAASVKQKVISALTYPLILIGFSIIVIVTLMAFVLPKVIEQFVKAGTDLPLITSMLLGISNNIFMILLFLGLTIAISVYAYKQYTNNLENKIKVHKNILRLPLIGNFVLTSELEKFASTMELLLASGTNLDIALDESAKIFNNKYPDIFVQLISSGYRSGNLVKMFKKVSEYMKTEIENKRSIFLSLLEPFVIICMGGFIMLIVLAILIPIMQMNTLGL